MSDQLKKSAKNMEDYKTPMLKSLDKALCVLLMFAGEKQEYTLMEIAKKLGLSKGTVHRILLTTINRGFIEQNPITGKYQLGIKMYELGSIVTKRMDLRREALPVLIALSKKTGETSHLIIENEGEALCIERIDGSGYVKLLFMDVGRRMPLNVGAGPVVLLAGMKDKEIERWLLTHRLEAKTDYSIVDPKKLMEKIEFIRENGYAVSMEDATAGVAAVGAPIKDVHGDTIGVVSIAGLCTRFQNERLELLISEVVDAGKQISYRMGWRG